MHYFRSPTTAIRFLHKTRDRRGFQLDGPPTRKKGRMVVHSAPYSSQSYPETSPVTLTVALLGSLALKTLHEPFHLACRVHDALLAREKRVALGADVNP
jgi:hypothetical protein